MCLNILLIHYFSLFFISVYIEFYKNGNKIIILIIFASLSIYKMKTITKKSVHYYLQTLYTCMVHTWKRTLILRIKRL